MDFKNLVFIFVFAGIYIFAMMSFAVNLTNDNNVNNTLMESQAVNSTFGNLEAQLQAVPDNANGSKSAFEQETPTLGTDSFLFGSIISAGKTFTTMITGVFNLMFGLISETLGVSPIILGVFSGLLLITIILLGWKLYKTGK